MNNSLSTTNISYILLTSVTLSIVILSFNGCGTGGIGGGNGDDDVQYVALGASDVTGVGASPLTNGYVSLIKEGLKMKA
jgi:hypothetical protein